MTANDRVFLLEIRIAELDAEQRVLQKNYLKGCTLEDLSEKKLRIDILAAQIADLERMKSRHMQSLNYTPSS